MSTNRNIVLANEQIYHLFNRGVEKRNVFTEKREYERLQTTLWFYRHGNPGITLSAYLNLSKEGKKLFEEKLTNKPMAVSLLAYCLMPNHFHLIVRQETTNGISRFIANLTNSYTKYFNMKHTRVGPLFQGIFRAVLVETDQQFQHLTRYVHLNPVTSFVKKIEELGLYPWSSYKEYLGEINLPLCNIALVKKLMPLKNYRRFVFNQAEYQQELEKIKHLILEK